MFLSIFSRDRSLVAIPRLVGRSVVKPVNPNEKTLAWHQVSHAVEGLSAAQKDMF